MKKTNLRKTSNPKLRSRVSAKVNHVVSAEQVIKNLYALLKQLDINIVDGKYMDVSRDSYASSSHPLYQHAPAIGEMLTWWHQDPNYLSNGGEPLLIRLKGRRPSFRELSKKFVPFLDEDLLLAELLNIGAISLDHSQFVRVHMRSFPAYEDKRLASQHTLTSLNDFIRTLRHNLNSNPTNSAQLFHRIASCKKFDCREMATLKVRVKRHGQIFLESFDDWLRRKDTRRKPKASIRAKSSRVSIGVYLSVDAK